MSSRQFADAIIPAISPWNLVLNFRPRRRAADTISNGLPGSFFLRMLRISCFCSLVSFIFSIMSRFYHTFYKCQALYDKRLATMISLSLTVTSITSIVSSYSPRRTFALADDSSSAQTSTVV